MQRKFMMGATTVRVIKINEETALDNLPAKIYTVNYDKFIGFYLDITKDKLTLPTKIYGKVQDRVDKCIASYIDRPQSTGILLTGDKGTGKTLLMSTLANQVISQLNIPVILVTQPFAGGDFKAFIEDIGECCLVFDEFGKMYSANDRHHNEGEVPQKELLSLMDGLDKTKRMFIMTENSQIDVNEFMLNRPSRIYYHFKYNKLDEDSIKGYAIDKGVSAAVLKDIVDLSRRSRIFSFDMLQSIVEEHLRFGTAVEDCIVDLNIDIRENTDDMVEILKVVDKATEEEREVYETPFIQRPTDYTYVRIKPNKPARKNATLNAIKTQAPKEVQDILEDIQDDPYEEFYINDSDLAYEEAGQLIYDTEEYTVVAKVVPTPFKSYKHFLL